MGLCNRKPKTVEIDTKFEKKFELKINSQFHFLLTLEEIEEQKVQKMEKLIESKIDFTKILKP